MQVFFAVTVVMKFNCQISPAKYRYLHLSNELWIKWSGTGTSKWRCGSQILLKQLECCNILSMSQGVTQSPSTLRNAEVIEFLIFEHWKIYESLINYWSLQRTLVLRHDISLGHFSNLSKWPIREHVSSVEFCLRRCLTRNEIFLYDC